MDDLTTLLLAAGDGDRMALHAFIRRSQADVWRFCAHLVDQQAADDLAQEVYVRAMGSVGRFRGDASARTWLLSIARRVCADEIRRRGRRRARERLTEHPVERPAPDSSDMTGLQDLVDELEPDRRAAFLLTQQLGLSYAEAAEALEVPIGTVRSRVARAREDLVTRLSAIDRETGAALVRVVAGLLGTVVGVTILVVLAAAVLSLEVRGHSMRPTLSDGQQVVANPFTDADQLERFDIVTLDPPGPTAPSIKRVIGMPGDRVRIVADEPRWPVQVQVDGQGPWMGVDLPAWEDGALDGEVCCAEDGTATGPTADAVVPDDAVWVAGDNIGHSDDSRAYGWVPLDAVSGRLWMRVWPLGVLGSVEPAGTLHALGTA